MRTPSLQCLWQELLWEGKTSFQYVWDVKVHKRNEYNQVNITMAFIFSSKALCKSLSSSSEANAKKAGFLGPPGKLDQGCLAKNIFPPTPKCIPKRTIYVYRFGFWFGFHSICCACTLYDDVWRYLLVLKRKWSRTAVRKRFLSSASVSYSETCHLNTLTWWQCLTFYVCIHLLLTGMDRSLESSPAIHTYASDPYSAYDILRSYFLYRRGLKTWLSKKLKHPL